MVHRQAGAHGGVIQPVAPRLLKRVVDLTIFITAAGARQLVGANDVEAMAGEIKILVGQLFAGGDVQHH